MFSQTRYKLNAIELAAQETVERRGADLTLLFLHGWLDNSASFLSLMQQLHSQLPEAHLVAVDLPGHGLSHHRAADNFYHFHDYIDDVHQLLSQMAPKKLVLIGHSLGALIASCYSAAFAEKVTALVQIEGFGPLSESPQNAARRLRQGIQSRQRMRNKPARGFTDFEAMVRLRAELNQLSEAQIRPLLQRGAEFDGLLWRWRHDARLKCDSLYRMADQHARAIVAAIHCPQLVVLGDNGFAHLEGKVDGFGDRDAICVETLAGGHHCHMQHPELVAEKIVELVSKI